jgi:hypothetical protein
MMKIPITIVPPIRVDDTEARRAAGTIACATALLVATGAALARENGAGEMLDARRMARLRDPRLFKRNPPLAWGAHAERRRLIRLSAMHPGLAHLVAWADAVPDGAFAITSNVDSQLQRAFFRADRIVELSGNVEWMQCARTCGAAVWPGGLVDVAIDAKTGRASEPLPQCPECGGVARPNVLMESDAAWDPSRALEQEDRLNAWLGELRAKRARKVVVLECGVDAGEATRARAERVAAAMGATIVRVHETDARVPSAGHVKVSLPVREALDAIAVEIRSFARDRL